MPYVAKYEMVDVVDSRTGISYRVRRRIDKRAPDDMLKDVVYAVRRACRVLDGAREAGLLDEPDPAALLLMAGVRIRQGELRRALPQLLEAAHAAQDALVHDQLAPTPRDATPAPPALPTG